MANTRLGDKVTINGKDAFTTYQADLYEFAPAETSTDDNTTSATLTFYVTGETEDGAYKNASNLITGLQKGTLNIASSGISYAMELTGYSNTASGVPLYRTVTATLTLEAVAAEVTINIASSATSVTINNPGNLPSPATIAINPGSTMATLSITGLSDEPIICKNLTSGKIRIIDGASGLVLEDSTNKYPDTELWEFPRLPPGSTTVKLSRSGCTMTIKYKPRYI